MELKDTKKMLLDLPGCDRIKTPKLSTEDRKSAAGILNGYSPLIAELTMERITNGLVNEEKDDTDLLKIMHPYLFKRQAQVIETITSEGSIDEETEQAFVDMVEGKHKV